jgi:hypothetical protein
MHRTERRPLLAAGAIACGTILVLAAPAAAASAADTHAPAKPAHRRNGAQYVVPGDTSGGSLSRRLSRSGGVLHPPPFSGSSTPVIPPPGTPGGNPNIRPK